MDFVSKICQGMVRDQKLGEQSLFLEKKVNKTILFISGSNLYEVVIGIKAVLTDKKSGYKFT